MKVEKVGDGEFGKPQPLSPLFAPALNERISKINDSILRSELSGLIVDVEEKGKRLYASKGRKEFEDYKASVKRFMHRVVQGSLRVEERHGKKKDGKFVIYLTMQKVDEAVENLGQMLLAGQQDSMRIVAALDEIRGMLLDTYL
ncbi:MAG TPA: YaaR family protein [bacterium]|nr:YaaR family protein [bacterium]